MTRISCFNAYYISGKVDTELEPDFAFGTCRAFAIFLSSDSVVIGRD